MRIIHRYTEAIIKKPILTLIILALITLVLGSGIRRLEFDTSVEAFLPPDDEKLKFYKAVKNIYGDIDTFVILAISDDNLWSRETFSRIEDLLSDLEEFKDYDASLEAIRINKLKAYINRDAVTWERLFTDFADDPCFMRFLKRKIKKPPVDGQAVISRRQITAVYNQAVKLNDLKKLEIIDKIISPFTTRDITGENDTLQAFDLIPKDGMGDRILPKTPEEFERFEKRLRRNPIFYEGIYSKDPKTDEITDFAFIIRFSTTSTAPQQDLMSREILDIVDAYKDLRIIPQGQPLIYVWIDNYIRRDMFHLVPLSLLVVTIILFLNFRTIRGILLPFTTLVTAMIWVMGLMGHLGVKITQLSTSLPPLLICVGSTYAIHVLNQYYEELDVIKKNGIVSGLAPTMANINLTVAIAGITTIISFWTLANHQTPALRVWGLFTGIGVMFAVIISMTLIPPSLALISHRHHVLPGKKMIAGSHMDLVAVLIRWLTKASLYHTRKVLIVMAVIVVLSVIGVFRLEVETELLQFFKDDNPIRVSEKIIGEKFGGRWGFNILIDSGTPGGVKSAAYLNTIDRIRKWLESDENKSLNVGRTDAFSDYIRTMHMAMNNDLPEFFTIPPNDADIVDYLEIYSDDDENSDGRADSLEDYVDPQFQTCCLLTRLRQREDYLIGTTEIKEIFKKISHHLSSTLPQEYSFSITGHPILFIQGAAYISGGQIQSLLQSAGVISLVVLVLLRNLRAGFLALIPLGLAVTLNFGVMGWLGIPLDVATSVIAAIAIGIGDDVTIHFINTWKHLRESGCSMEESIQKTLLESGRANIYSALALICGCLVFLVSTFKPIILFGMLMILVIAANNIGALLLLPSVIKLIRFDIKIKKPKTLLVKQENIV